MSRQSKLFRAVVFHGDSLIRDAADGAFQGSKPVSFLHSETREFSSRLQESGFGLGIQCGELLDPELRSMLAARVAESDLNIIFPSSDLISVAGESFARPLGEALRWICQELKIPHSSCVAVVGNSGDCLNQAVNSGVNVIFCAGGKDEPLSIHHPVQVAVAVITELDQLEGCLQLMAESNQQFLSGNELFRQRKYDQSADAFVAAANLSLALRDRFRASGLFARAAIAQENTEIWRNTSVAWYRVGQCLTHSNVSNPVVTHKEYDLSEHHYPSISFEQWDRIPVEERRARAYRYAGYHAQNTNSPQDSYLLYRLSAAKFEELGLCEKAAEVLVDACISFIKEYADLSDDYIGQLLRLINAVPFPNSPVDPGALYLRQVASALRARGNAKRADQLLIAAYVRETKRMWKRRKYFTYLIYFVWRNTSMYGTSLTRWATWTIALSFLLFPAALIRSHGIIGARSWGAYVYSSFLAFATVGLPSPETLARAGKIILCVEAGVGYVFLAILATLILRKIS